MKCDKTKLWLLGMFLLIVGIGCDGFIWVEGRAYRSMGKPNGIRSQIQIDELEYILPAVELIPLEDTKITLFHSGDYSKTSLNENTIWKNIVITDNTGKFNINSVTAPGKNTYILRAEKQGYEPSQKLFLHSSGGHNKHNGIIILVPEDNDIK